MNNRYETAKTPLRADARPAGGLPTMAATKGGLIRSTLVAAGSAGALLVLFWLPAEYGIDPTGIGALTGLTEMGEIKQQLAAEAVADAAAVAAAAAVPAPNAAPVPAEVLQRLDQIDAKLAVIAATIGAPQEQALVADPPAPAKAEPAPPPSAEWRDEASYTLNPGEGIEVKLAMQNGQVARFEWTANGGVVNFDLHGDGGGEKISYEAARAVPQASGELVAAFTGNHGWFWRNRTDAPVTVTLRTGGVYEKLLSP